MFLDWEMEMNYEVECGNFEIYIEEAHRNYFCRLNEPVLGLSVGQLMRSFFDEESNYGLGGITDLACMCVVGKST